MFRPYKVRDGQIEILDLLLHRLSAIDEHIVVAIDKQDLRTLSVLREELDEAVDELIHIVLSSQGQEEPEGEEDSSDALRSKGPIGFSRPESSED